MATSGDRNLAIDNRDRVIMEPGWGTFHGPAMSRFPRTVGRCNTPLHRRRRRAGGRSVVAD